MKNQSFFNSIQDTVEVIKIDDSDDSDIEVQTNPFNKGEKKILGQKLIRITKVKKTKKKKTH